MASVAYVMIETKRLIAYKVNAANSLKDVNDETREGVESDPLGIVQEIDIWPYYQMVYPKPESFLEKETHKILWDFEKQTDPLIPARRLN